MNMEYAFDTARTQTRNLFRPKWAPSPQGHSDGLGMIPLNSFHESLCVLVNTIANRIIEEGSKLDHCNDIKFSGSMTNGCLPCVVTTHSDDNHGVMLCK